LGIVWFGLHRHFDMPSFLELRSDLDCSSCWDGLRCDRHRICLASDLGTAHDGRFDGARRFVFFRHDDGGRSWRQSSGSSCDADSRWHCWIYIALFGGFCDVAFARLSVTMPMGVHFTVTVDHDITDTSLDAMRRRFTSLGPIFAEISSKYQLALTEWEDSTEKGRPSPDHFRAPSGFSLGIGHRSLRLHHFIRFSAFIDNSSEREILCRFSRQLARTLGQSRVLYAPCEGIGDTIYDWVTDGLSLIEIIPKLQHLSKRPLSIDELASRSLPELPYFVDEFEEPPK
jgi:hypothetical protein